MTEKNIADREKYPVYDIVVIGGGVAGCEAAIEAARMGMRTALVEKSQIGGVCLNSGCIPSKSYLASAHQMDCVSKCFQEGGFANPQDMRLWLRSGFLQARERKNRVVDSLREGMAAQLKHAKVDIIYGYATYAQEKGWIEVRINIDTVFCKNLVLATGSKTVTGYLPGIEEEIQNGFVCTNAQLFDLEEVPKSLVIIGGGVSGVEMADCFASFGSNITILEKRTDILFGFDRDLAHAARKSLEAKGIKIWTGVAIEAVSEGTVFYTDSEGNEKDIACSKVYLSSGREPERSIFQDLDIERACFPGPYKTKQNNIVVIGDACGSAMLAHKAIEDARRAAAYFHSGKAEEGRYVIPKAIYLSPECAQVGIMESADIDKGHCRVQKVSMNYSGRYVADHGGMDNTGFVKMIFDTKRRLIGAAISSAYACELISIFQILVQEGKTADDILTYCFPHPTEGEAIRACVKQYLANEQQELCGYKKDV